MVSNGKVGTRRTHVEDMEDPIEIRLPRRNSVFVVPRAEESGGPAAPASFQDLRLDFCNGPAIQAVVSGWTGDVYRRFDLRR
jgi:hypothetical protein